MAPEHFEDALPRNAANHVALSPLSFIRRARHVFPDHPAVIHGELNETTRPPLEKKRWVGCVDASPARCARAMLAGKFRRHAVSSQQTPVLAPHRLEPSIHA